MTRSEHIIPDQNTFSHSMEAAARPSWKIWAIAALLVIAGLFSASCSKDEFGDREMLGQHGGQIVDSNRKGSEETRQVLLLYLAGYNDLAGFINKNLDTLQAHWLPNKNRSSDVLLVFSKIQNFKNGDESPVLFRMYADRNGEAARDTLKIFTPGTVAASARTLKEVLQFVHEEYPAKRYGMLFSSHATGWLPEGYYNGSQVEKEEPLAISSPAAHPAPWSIGQETQADENGKKKYEISITNFAKAIPMKLDYLILDVCLTGGIEMAYELRDKVQYMLASQTETLADGIQYSTLTRRLFKAGEPDLKGVCEDYYNQYAQQQEEVMRSATISLIDCSRLTPLQQTCKTLFERYRQSISLLHEEEVQGFFRYRKHYFFDLKDILVQAGARPDDVAELEAALQQCVVFEAHTPKFLEIMIRTSCGLSMYLPSMGNQSLNEYYRTLAWNQATGLVK